MSKSTAKPSSAKKTSAKAPPREIGPSITVKIGKVEVMVLGTAHVSRESVLDVEESFASMKPDAVAVELCAPRYEAMSDPDRWRKLDLARLVKDKKLGLLASSLILSSFQKKIGDSTGVKPGEEMLRASQLANEGDVKLVLADREVRTTLTRAWSRVGFFSKLWLASTLLASLLVKEEVDEAEIERMKRDDVLSDLFSQLPRRYDAVKQVIIDERDAYLAESIYRAAEELEADPANKRKKKLKMLAVVGAGHLAGIQRRLENQERSDLDVLNEQPPRRRFKNIVSWLGVSLLAAGMAYFLREKDTEDIWKLLYLWVLTRSIGSGVGALLARAHPVTVLVTAAVAPFSLFILGTRLWMFSALTELYFRKPRVEDFENIAQDTDQDSFMGLMKGIYSNRVLKFFLIIFLVSMGLTVGNLIFGVDVVRQLWATP